MFTFRFSPKMVKKNSGKEIDIFLWTPNTFDFSMQILLCKWGDGAILRHFFKLWLKLKCTFYELFDFWLLWELVIFFWNAICVTIYMSKYVTVIIKLCTDIPQCNILGCFLVFSKFKFYSCYWLFRFMWDLDNF